MVVGNIGIFIGSCIVLWYGTGLIVSAVDGFARGLKLSPFALSFFILGLLTSLPEMAVGASALAEGTPEVFVGNLLGGIPIIFLLVIPLVAIFGNGIKINHELTPTNLFVTFAVVAAPALFVLDSKVTNVEGVLLILFYLMLFVLLEDKKGGVLSLFFNKQKVGAIQFGGFAPIKILFGAVLVFVSAHFLLAQTVYFAKLIGVLPFYVSLIALSLGTNIPELSMAIRSIVQGKKDIAFGDYMGSAAANTLLFGIFTLLAPAESFAVNHSLLTFGFIVGGLVLFYLFYRTKHEISRAEGFALLGMYLLFAFLELQKG